MFFGCDNPLITEQPACIGNIKGCGDSSAKKVDVHSVGSVQTRYKDGILASCLEHVISLLRVRDMIGSIMSRRCALCCDATNHEFGDMYLNCDPTTPRPLCTVTHMIDSVYTTPCTGLYLYAYICHYDQSFGGA